MIRLPKIKRDPKKTEALCRCRPLCKGRRREWKGQILRTSGELLLERKPVPECVRRRPMELYPNGPCPIFGRNKHVVVNQRKAKAVRLCQAPLDLTVDTPYLDYLADAVRLGALPLPERIRCAFCSCGSCCACACDYEPHDAERTRRRREHMREFDARVRLIPMSGMRIMYDS